MRVATAAILAALAGFALASMLGVATAEAPTTTALRTLSVEGVGTAGVSQTANKEEADASYRQGMAAAITDGQGKAEFLAAKAGVTLGAVQSIAERGGSIECSSPVLQYVQYEGEQPDFGETAQGERVVEPLAAAPAVSKAVKPKKKRKPAAKTASGLTCMLTADVGLVYPIS